MPGLSQEELGNIRAAFQVIFGNDAAKLLNEVIDEFVLQTPFKSELSVAF